MNSIPLNLRQRSRMRSLQQSVAVLVDRCIENSPPYASWRSNQIPRKVENHKPQCDADQGRMLAISTVELFGDARLALTS